MAAVVVVGDWEGDAIEHLGCWQNRTRKVGEKERWACMAGE